MKTALFPGTFDPFTLGHASVVERALGLFDHIVIAIGCNSNKKGMFTSEERLIHINACYENEPRVEVCTYDGMTYDLAMERNIKYILRGIRSVSDYEYEKLLSDINKKIAGVETVIFITDPEYSCVQSNVVRDLLYHHKDVSAFVPEEINKLLKK
jgi:pantetheine-phosphate adenylyltransferase